MEILINIIMSFFVGGFASYIASLIYTNRLLSKVEKEKQSLYAKLESKNGLYDWYSYNVLDNGKISIQGQPGRNKFTYQSNGVIEIEYYFYNENPRYSENIIEKTHSARILMSDSIRGIMDFEYGEVSNGIRPVFWRKLKGINFIFTMTDDKIRTAYCQLNPEKLNELLANGNV